jgi:DNA-binding IclR family transcriptional regulator
MDETSSKDSKQMIQSVASSLEIINVLSHADDSMSVTQVSDAVGLSPSSVHKHLQTLREYGFVTKKETNYQLGLEFLNIGGEVREFHLKNTNIKPQLQSLSQETGRNTYFTVEESGQAIILFREVGENGVPLSARIGTRYYMHQIAGGKAILSEYPRARVEEIIQQHGLPAATEHTITDPETLFEDLEKVRELGYATTREESTQGVQAIAAPVTHPEQGVLGACAIGGPVHQIRDEEEELVRRLQSTVNELELTIAYS